MNLNKQDIFPLGHIIVNNVVAEEQVLRFNITVIACDIVDQSKTETLDRFVGNNNEQDILNTQLSVLNKLIQNKFEINQAKIKNIIKTRETVLWNGPAGDFENPNFANGTKKILEIITNKRVNGKIYAVAGGGETVAVINKFEKLL